jgi:hypothetical protein
MELWEALWLALKGPLTSALAAIQDALGGRLWVDLAPYVDFSFWSRDFISQHRLWLGQRIGLACFCWILLTFHWRTRYWALFPFQCIWHFLILLHIMVWPLSAHYPMEREYSRTHMFSFIFRSLGTNQDINENTNEATNDTPGKGYRGPRVKRGPRSNASGLIEPVDGQSR